MIGFGVFHTGCQLGLGSVFPPLQRCSVGGPLVKVAVSLALPAVFCLSGLLMAGLFLIFIVGCCLVFTPVGEAFSGLSLGFLCFVGTVRRDILNSTWM